MYLKGAGTVTRRLADGDENLMNSIEIAVSVSL